MFITHSQWYRTIKNKQANYKFLVSVLLVVVALTFKEVQNSVLSDFKKW